MTVESSLIVGQDPNDIRTFIAAEALEAHRLVVFNSSDRTKVEYPSGQFGTGLIGITLHSAPSGAEVAVAVGGFALLEVDGSAANIVPGDSIVAHTNDGLGQKAAGGTAGNREAIGKAYGASTADGDLIPVRVSPHTVYFAS